MAGHPVRHMPSQAFFYRPSFGFWQKADIKPKVAVGGDGRLANEATFKLRRKLSHRTIKGDNFPLGLMVSAASALCITRVYMCVCVCVCVCVRTSGCEQIQKQVAHMVRVRCVVTAYRLAYRGGLHATVAQPLPCSTIKACVRALSVCVCVCVCE